MDYLEMLASSLLPAILLFAYIYWADRKRPEPIGWLLKGLLFGVISVFIALPGEEVVSFVFNVFGISSMPLVSSFCDAVFGAAVPEECAKLLMLWLLLRKNPHFDERMDGIVYAVTVGLGFAAFENVGYILGDENWQSTAITRAIFSVPGHYAFAVLMGYYYALVHFDPQRYSHLRPLILIAPIIAHSVFDALLMWSSDISEAAPLLALIILAGFVYFCVRMHKYCKQRINLQLQRDDTYGTFSK